MALAPELDRAFVLLLVSVLAYGPPHAAAEGMADLAVWQIVNKKRTYTGTAFAIRERHFLTNAHVIEGFVDHDSKRIVLRHAAGKRRLDLNRWLDQGNRLGPVEDGIEIRCPISPM